MQRQLWPRWALVLAWLLVSGVVTARAAAAEVRIRDWRGIFLPAAPHDAERSMAEVLRKSLRDLYSLDLPILSGALGAEQPGIVLGREAAAAAGMITAEELDAVKHDGYVIKGLGGRIALAGYAPQGTMYATYALLRRVGLRLYPWRDFEAVEVRRPLPAATLEPWVESSKPFFVRRDLLGYLDRGRWGASLTEYSLGDFRAIQDHPDFRGKGWLGADHTAAYLVPMAKYRDAHPEYYALRDGERLPKDTQNARVALCLSNPAVHRIAAERAVEWMAEQQQRRFFHISDGDTRECRCPQCLAMDPDPTSCTDRYLTWVNSVAGAVKDRFPENVVMALAYGNATRPPRGVRPASNVTVLYCPWYWNSRTTSATGWANPLNITAMKEFTAWAMRFPGQMGLYDYPDSWVHGQAERLKFLAKRGAKVFYACGGNGDLYQWVNARLLWDPWLNTEDLVEEFVQAYYGPASGSMGEYLRGKRRTLEQRLVHTRDPFADAGFLKKSAELLRLAGQAALAADDRTQARVLASVGDEHALILRYTHPDTGDPPLRWDPATYRRELEMYVARAARVADLFEKLGNRYAAKVHRSELLESLQSLNVAAAPAASVPDLPEKADALLKRVLQSFDARGARSSSGKTASPKDQPQATIVRFDLPDEPSRWIADGPQAALVQPPKMAAVRPFCGEPLTGVLIRAPHSRLPVIAYGQQKIHAGRFYAERAFDPPIDAAGCPFLDFHLYASADVPATIYINDVHSDVDLHAGEQIVRVDLRNFDQQRRFSYSDWDKRVRRVSFDFWPQDNYFPYPDAKDAEIVLLAMTATHQTPTPDRLPHRGRSIWLSQFRANIPRGVAVPRELYDPYLQRQRYKHVGLDYGSRWISERFRTFTEHRVVSPVFAILVGAGASAAERRAADHLQTCLEHMFGVRLPTREEPTSDNASLGNVVLVGRGACLAAERVTEEELRYVGPGGFLINAHQGRIAIAGADGRGTLCGATRYLEDHGARFFTPRRTKLPDLRADLLHELYLPDWPVFRETLARVAWFPLAEANSPEALGGDTPPTPAELASANQLAEAIKKVARTGDTQLPPAVLAEASRSTLGRYVAGKLLWDPFADARRLMREFAAEE